MRNLRHKATASSVLLFTLIFLTLVGLSCAPDEGESPTRGKLLVVTAESVSPAVKEIVEEFNRTYPNAHVSLVVSSSREAIVKLLNNEVKVAVVGRGLNSEEQDVVEKYNLYLDTFKVAYDGIAVLVHPSNPIDHLSLRELQQIITGKVKTWRELSPRGRRSPEILLAIGGPNFSIHEILRNTLANNEPLTTNLYPCSTSTQVLQLTRERPEAIGFVGSNWIQGDPPGVKILELGSDEYITEAVGTGVKYFAPHPAHVYREYYPLRRTIYILSREKGYGLAAGFIRYMTGPEGQRIFKDNGLVPATMPVRLVPFTGQ